MRRCSSQRRSRAHETPCVNPPIVFDWRAGNDPACLRSREWLVTNGTGSYASGTVLGVATRRFHGLLVANLAEPKGRFMTLARLDEELVCDGEHHALGGAERDDERLDTSAHRWLRSFRLERLMPQWELECAGRRFEKTIVMPHGHNVVCVRYRPLAGEALSLNVRPSAAFRRQDAPAGTRAAALSPRDRGRAAHARAARQLARARWRVSPEHRVPLAARPFRRGVAARLRRPPRRARNARGPAGPCPRRRHRQRERDLRRRVALRAARLHRAAWSVAELLRAWLLTEEVAPQADAR
jgi:hypothetical protein